MSVASPVTKPLEHFERARECGERGGQCANATSIAAQLRQLTEKAKLLAWLEQQKEQIALRLSHELHISTCQEAVRIYNDARQKAGAFELRLARWWERQVAHARDRLRQQERALPTESSLFTKIEPAVCVAILTVTPDADTLAKIEKLQSAVDDLERQVEREVNDFEASNHSEYLTVEPKDVLRRQIELCEQLKTELRELQYAVQVCRTYLQNGIGLEQRLEKSAKKLDQWLEKLKGFERDLSSTIALVDAAMRTGDFQPAHESMGRAVGTVAYLPTRSAPQPGMAFAGFTLHPTFIWLREFIEGQKSRRLKQEAHKQYVEWGFTLETVLTVSELDAIATKWQQENQTAPPDLRQKRTGFITDFRRALNLGRYPLEYTFERLEKMHADESEDVCRLQAQLVYTDPETNTSYEGYERIRPVLRAKVTQIQNMREWLAQFNVVAPHITVRRECPGVVPWGVERSLIEAQRDKCELEAALAHCRQVRNGAQPTANADDALFNGLWPLERAKAGLERPMDDLRKPLSAAARALDKERVARIEELSKWIDECLKMEQDIVWRMQNRQNRLDELREQYARLQNTRDSIAVRLFRQTHLVEEARALYRTAYDRYAEVCPRDPVLDEFIRDD